MVYYNLSLNISPSPSLSLFSFCSLAQVVKIFFAITTYISYALQGYVTAHIVWNQFLSKRIANVKKHTLYELCFRAFIVLLTCK